MRSTPASRRGRAALLAVVLGLTGIAGGCSWHQHTVGLGPNGIGEESARQFYWGFGLVRWNEVDTQRMTHDLRSYRITTYYGFWDILLAPVLLPIFGSTSRTVVVER
ncbi:MAG: hypothetical protein U1F36_18260 [Planctomycetota bacterium]